MEDNVPLGLVTHKEERSEKKNGININIGRVAVRTLR